MKEMTSRKSKVISLSLAQGVLMIVSVVSGMVFARTLTVADYGTYLQTFLAYDFAVPILTLGLPSALYYFLPGAKERQKGLVLDNIFLLFITGVIFSLFLILGGTELLAKRFNNPELSKTLRWMIFYPLYTFPVLLASAVWVSKDKVKLNAVYNVFTGLILTIFLIAAALLTRSYTVPTLVRILVPVLFLPISLYLIFKYIPGEWDKPRLSSMWSMAKFSIPLGLASVFGTLAIQLAGIIVSLLTSPEDFAIYANGAKEVPLIGIVTGSISIVIMADMAHKIKQGDLKTALELFRKAAMVSASFLLPAMIFLMIYAESFINILYSSKYEASVIPFRIYLLVIPVRIAYYASAFVALGRTKAIFMRSIVDLGLTAVFCYLFVSWLGAYGAALGLVTTLFLWSVPFNLYSLSKSFSCKPTQILPFNKIGRILLISFFSGILPTILLIVNFSPIISFSLGAGIFGIIYFFTANKYIPEFNLVVKPFIRKVITTKF
jgi:O-antigen/teichoic acid export membrane protein